MEGRAGWCGLARGCCHACPEAAERRSVEALLACSGTADEEDDEEEEEAVRTRGAWAEEVHGWRRSAPYSLLTPNSARRRGATGPSTAPTRGSAATFRHGTPGRPAAARRAARESGGPGAARETWDLATEPGSRLATLQQTTWGRWTGDEWKTRTVHSEGSSPRGCYPDPNEQDEEKDDEQDEEEHEEEHEEVEERGEVEELSSAVSQLHVASRAIVRDEEEDCATSTDERNEDWRGAHRGPMPESGSKASAAHDSDQGPNLPPSFSLYSVLPPVRGEARGSLANPASGLSDPWRHLDADVLRIDNCRRVESAPAGRGSGGLNHEPAGRQRWRSSQQPAAGRAAGRAARRATGSRAHERAARMRCGVGTAGRKGGRTGKDVTERPGSGGGSGGDGGNAESVGNVQPEGFGTRDEHRARGRLPLVQGCKVRIPMVPHTLLL
ncbi:uncharacterized protein LOC116945737 [Petromyzon marinus]|uniref:uncharacterized protein LOC116945737 n=1 Tax=Petromyzon marinus TaxID=7757 RepID=UPI003F7292AE